MTERHASTIETRVLGWLSAGLLLGSLLFAAGAMIYGLNAQSLTDEQIGALIYTPILCLLCGVVGVVSNSGIRIRRLVWLMRLTVAMAALTTAVALLFLWRWVAGAPAASESLAVLGSISIAVAAMVIIGQLLVPRVKSSLLELVRRMGAVGMGLYGLAMIGLIWTGPLWQAWSNTVAVASTVWGLLTISFVFIIGLLFKASNKPAKMRNETLPNKLSLRLTCPNCNEEQTLGTGLTRCGSCRYVMIIEIEEPRCECGYLIYKLQGDTCPECGMDIPANKRWSPSTVADNDGDSV